MRPVRGESKPFRMGIALLLTASGCSHDLGYLKSGETLDESDAGDWVGSMDATHPVRDAANPGCMGTACPPSICAPNATCEVAWSNPGRSVPLGHGTGAAFTDDC